MNENKKINNDIKLLALDFDGVLTNNEVIVDEDGKESVICNRSDSLGIVLLKKKGIDVIVISKETNKVVKTRCDKLKISCSQGIDDKISILKKEISKRGLKPKEVCFIGNDVNDIDCIKYVGLGVAVNDAYPEVKKAARIVTKKNGGEGAVREIIDTILK
jgi:YrbI family 3-deoxy-D-manno-octulosonate 8-phosphate phosphatase